MARLGQFVAIAFLLGGLAGCQSLGPMREPSPLIAANSCPEDEQNPVFIPPLPYGHLFETLLHVLHDYDFEIAESNRADEHSIEAVPRVSPGVLQLFRPGSPDLYDRLLATFQSYRHRVSVKIHPATNGGYFVEVIARKELEDLPRPIRSTVGGAVFRSENGVERQFEVVDPIFYDSLWVFKGRDVPLEQELIRRIRKQL